MIDFDECDHEVASTLNFDHLPLLPFSKEVTDNYSERGIRVLRKDGNIYIETDVDYTLGVSLYPIGVTPDTGLTDDQIRDGVQANILEC